MPMLRSLTLLMFLPAVAAAGDWPQFLGPTRDNRSPETIAPWTGDLKTLWKVPIGPAHSSPIVHKGIVYAFYEPKGKDADALAAYDLATGERKWEHTIAREEFQPPFGYGPRGTPAIAGDGIFTLGGTGILAKWDLATGNVVWKVDTLKEFKVENLPFGVSGSPLVHDGLVFVNVGGKGAGLVAFDAATGQVAWQKTDDGMSYSSPIVVGAGAEAKVVFLTKPRLIAVDPKTGAEAWSVPFRDELSESATTPVAANGLLIGSSVTLGSIALDLKNPTVPVWKKRNLNCYFSTPVAVGDDLYMLNGILKINPEISLRCVEAKTGKIRWEKPSVGKYHAAIVKLADDKLLMLDDGGSLTLVEANAKEFKPLAKSNVCKSTWAHPALADGIVVLRDEKEMMAYRLQ
jgi:outer membrane protein assembly factor BamB